MRKFLIIASGLFFLGAALIPALDAAKDRYHSYRYSDPSERRFSQRIGPYHYRPVQRSRAYWRVEHPYFRDSVRQPKRVIVEQRQNFREIKAKDVPFYFGVPLGFELTEDTLEWDEGSIKVDKFGTSIEVVATDFNCNGGNFARRYCVRDRAKELEAEFKEDFPGMEVKEDKLISLQIQTSSIVSPNKSENGHYLLLEGRSEKVAQFVFAEPHNNYIWVIYFRSDNEDNALLNQDHTVRRIINSLFKSPKKKFVVRSKDRAWYQAQKRGTSERRFTSGSGMRHITRTPKVSGRSLNYQKTRAYYIPFEMRTPQGFVKTSDTLDFENGEMKLRNGKGSTIRVFATENKCEGRVDRKSGNSERKAIRDCLQEKAELLSKRIRGTEEVLILDDRNINLRTTFNQTSYQEVGRFFTAIIDGRRTAQLTFRDPTTQYVWHIEMKQGQRDSFLEDAQKLYKVIASPFFRTEN